MNQKKALWTVGEVAEHTRVSIRTLHHYDQIGLLRPSERSAAHYRLYTQTDLARLHQILTFRELGFALADIAPLLGAGREAEIAALHLQAELLREQLHRTQRRLDTVTSMLQAAVGGEGAKIMTREEMKELFGSFDPTDYEDEARERWGHTEEYRQSQERTSRYTAADWQKIKQESDDLNARYVALMERGVAPQSAEAQAISADQYAHMSRWFFEPRPEVMCGIAKMWVSDERFTRNIDQRKPGLAAYQSAAMLAWLGQS